MQFPVDEIKDEFLDALNIKFSRILLKAPTGSGKSTIVPKWVLDNVEGIVLVSEPRRVAARMLAEYVSSTISDCVGNCVGYITRFESQRKNSTKLLYVTDGILEKILIENPSLEGISAIIFDEFHERRLSGDISLGKIIKIQKSKRSDLRLIVMSATLQGDYLQRYLGEGCVFLETKGRSYPVDIFYRPLHLTRDKFDLKIWDHIIQVLSSILQEGLDGDVLIFLPGIYEINKTIEVLSRKKNFQYFDVIPLYSTLTPSLQNKALYRQKESPARIIVATNIAETSLSLEGIKVVIDSGLARISVWDSNRGIDTLHIKKISQAAAEQRAGRAGRFSSGKCYRLWSQSDQIKRDLFELPEVARVDISRAILSIIGFGCRKISDFAWLDFPSEQSLERAIKLLRYLEAITENNEGFKLTEIGERMLKFSISPRLSRLLLSGMENDCLEEMCFIASIIESENLWDKIDEKNEEFLLPYDTSDFAALWRGFCFAKDNHFSVTLCNQKGIRIRGAREILKTMQQLCNVVQKNFGISVGAYVNFEINKENIEKSLLQTFPDCFVVKNGSATLSCKGFNGRKGKLMKGVSQKGKTFISCEITEIGKNIVETQFKNNTQISPDLLKEIFPDKYHISQVSVWDEIKRRVVGKRREVFFDLIISEEEKGEPDSQEASEILSQLVYDGELILKNWNYEVEQWIRRLNLVARVLPEIGLPEFTEEDKKVALTILCEGAKGFKEIKDREILPILEEWLNDQQKFYLAKYAPTKVILENGQNVKIFYNENGEPNISLTLQRLIGVKNTPTIAMGKVGIVVEILAPNQRPWQITSNLAGFWKNSYPQMKKELSGRYPKHKWI